MKNSVLFLTLISLPCAFGANISQTDFLKRVEDRFPSIESQLLKIQAVEAKLQKSEGAFDSKLNFATKKYLEGYYDSEFSEVSVGKPIKTANSLIELGHRRSNGKVPVYYAEEETLSGGEYFLRFKASLLKYREIDPKRFELFVNSNKASIEKLSYALKVMDIKQKANKLYWKWVTTNEKVQIYSNLVKLNQERLNAVRKRVEKKDLAQIYLVESEQYLLGFKSELAQLNALNNITRNLLKYYDTAVDQESLPVYSAPKRKIDSKIGIGDTSEKIKMRPELKILDLMLSNTDADILNSKQKIQPKLDFKIEHSNSSGSNDEMFGDETLLGFNVEIPIETNFARGDISRAKAEQKILINQKTLTERELSYQLNNYLEELNGLVNSLNFVIKEVENAKKLQEAEWKKFKAGASDFFLVNTRDINYAKARVKLIEKYASYEIFNFELKQFISPIKYSK